MYPVEDDVAAHHIHWLQKRGHDGVQDVDVEREGVRGEPGFAGGTLREKRAPPSPGGGPSFLSSPTASLPQQVDGMKFATDEKTIEVDGEKFWTVMETVA